MSTVASTPGASTPGASTPGASTPGACPAGDAPPRSYGRPRDVRLDAAILQATLELLASGGYAALTMEAVAARAGVGKATLYRRYAGKDQLVVEAVASLSEPAEVENGGGVRDQLVTMLEGFARRADSSLAMRIFPRLVGESFDHPQLMERYREQVIRPRRERYAAALRLGVREGLIRPDLDLEYAIDLLVGPFVYRMHTGASIPSDLAGRVVDDVLSGLTPR